MSEFDVATGRRGVSRWGEIRQELEFGALAEISLRRPAESRGRLKRICGERTVHAGARRG
jgi:hypothetical protein